MALTTTNFRRLSSILDAFERKGKLNFRSEELRPALPHMSDEALRKALYRQQRTGRLVRVAHGAGHWLIVPLQYATAGSPPLETWLDTYLSKTLQLPYYVGLLSAAETYGASPYAVMLTQVMIPRPRRSISVGRHKIVFHVCADAERLPTRWHESSEGRYKVSSPELTALDLIQRTSPLGGISRIREVLRTLWSHCASTGLVKALEALQNVPTAQRLGTLLALDNQTELLSVLSRWLADKPIRLVALEGALPSASERTPLVNTDFKVWMKPLQQANL